MKLIIWSIDNCVSCARAEMLCKTKKIEYEVFKVGDKPGCACTLSEFKAIYPDQKTFPLITYKNEFIGGYEALVSYLTSKRGTV